MQRIDGFSGPGCGIRTHGLLVPNQARYQTSLNPEDGLYYTPIVVKKQVLFLHLLFSFSTLALSFWWLEAESRGCNRVTSDATLAFFLYLISGIFVLHLLLDFVLVFRSVCDRMLCVGDGVSGWVRKGGRSGCRRGGGRGRRNCTGRSGGCSNRCGRGCALRIPGR